MFCTNCGAQINDGTKFCPKCGVQVGGEQAPVVTPVEPVTPVYAEPVMRVKPKNDTSTSILVLGILALALCELGIPGIILGAIAKKKAGQFVADNGVLYGKAKVGRILGNFGFIIGIVMTVFWVIYIGAIASIGAASCVSYLDNVYYY